MKSCALSGEAADVDDDVMDEWVKRLPDILKGFKMEDISNGD